MCHFYLKRCELWCVSVSLKFTRHTYSTNLIIIAVSNCGDTHMTTHNIPPFSQPFFLTALLPLSAHPSTHQPYNGRLTMALSRSLHLCLLASNAALFRATTSERHYASHVCQICHLTNGREGWSAEIRIKEGSPGCIHS